MKFILSTLCLLCTNILLSQVNSFPYTESFEQAFKIGSNIDFIPNWLGNTIGTRNRIFAGSDPRTGNQSLNIIPTSSFKGTIEISLDLRKINNPKVSFYAFSKKNGSSSSSRPVLLSISTSIDGGLNYSSSTQIGNEKTFPNNDSTSYSHYTYKLPIETSGKEQVRVKLVAERGNGSGSSAELVLDDLTIESQILPLEIVSIETDSKNSVKIVFNQPLEESSVQQVKTYSINNGIIIHDVVLSSSTTVTLSTSSFENSTYQISATGLKALSTNVPAGSFVGNFTFIEPLRIQDIKVLDKRSLLLEFNLSLADSLAEVSDHYVISSGIRGPIRARLDSQLHNQVLLTLPTDLRKESYELVINGIRDKSGLAIAKDLTQKFDYLPLELSDLLVITPTEIELTFNQKVDVSSAQMLDSYALDFDLKPIFISLFDSIVNLKLNRSLVNNTYTLVINDVVNLSGNAIAQNIKTEFKNDAPTLPRQILINEIFADPSGDHEPNPTVLPNDSRDEYVELYNNTLRAIDITGFQISGGIVDEFVLMPKAYVILTARNNVEKFEVFGNTVGVSSWNSLSNNGEPIVLHDNLGYLVDSLTYDKSWYNDLDKSKGGWSIELINPNPSCIGPHNWSSSIDKRGGSPGEENSIYNPIPDNVSPQVIEFHLANDTSLLVSFNEAMELSTLRENNFALSQGNSIKGLYVTNSLGTEVEIHLSEKPIEGLLHNIRLSNLRDCSGNLLQESTYDFYIGATPAPNDVIITEIMASPTPSQGLPEAEYIEVYNRSDRILQMAGTILADANNSTTLEDFALWPDQYLILTTNSASQEFESNGSVLGVRNWVSLNNSEDQLSIFNTIGSTVHSVSYSDTWYQSLSKAVGGFSLEMIDPNFPCLEETNWTASNSSTGGSPGQPNSVQAENPDMIGPKLLKAVTIDPSTIMLHFNEKLNPSTIEPTRFTGNYGLSFIAAIVNEDGKTIQLTSLEDLTENTVYTIHASNMTDCSGNLISQNDSSIELIVSAKAAPQDVIINEILFNPRSGGVRFVEIYNNSAKYINLKNWKLQGNTNTRIIAMDNLFIAPRQFYTISDDSRVLKTQYPNARSDSFIELTAMPSLPSDTGTVTLLNSEQLMIDEFSYSEDYHSPLITDSRGVSLERIRYTSQSNDPENWFSASSTEFSATPGYENSQSHPSISMPGEIKVSPLTFAPESSGGNNFTTINYAFKTRGNTLNISIIDSNGIKIKALGQNIIAGRKGFLTWDGTTDQLKRARIGYYMVLIEIISPQGDIRHSRSKVAIGTFF